MSKLNKKSGVKLAVLSLIGLLGLTACGSDEDDEIYSKPSNYDNAIVTIDGHGKDDIHNNVLSIIYDAMHEGSLSSKVLDEAIYRYACSVFGQYNPLTSNDDSITLKDAVISYERENTTEKIYSFIRAHKAYWNYNEKGEHVDDNGEKVEDDSNFIPCSAEIKHVTSRWDAIETRIAENMYSRSVGGSYTSNHYYSELAFLKSLYQAGQKVANYPSKIDTLTKIIVPYTVEEEDVFEEFTDFNGAQQVALHREFYQDSAAIEVTGDAATALYDACKNTYIEDVVIPEVYKDLLVEQYLLDEDVSAVRNSRARKINVIKIPKYSGFTSNAAMLKNALINEIYKLPADGAALRTSNKQIEDEVDALFKTYALVSNGLYDQIAADEDAPSVVTTIQDGKSYIYEVATKTINENGVDVDYSYYKNTTYGDLVEDYAKICEQVAANEYLGIDDSLYSTFTNNNSRSLKEGFEQQLIDIMQTKTLTSGWYIQSQTPSLDSNGKINERLFKLSVANAKEEIAEEADVKSEQNPNGVDPEVRDAAIASLKSKDRFVQDPVTGVWSIRDKDEASRVEDKFLCSINGAYFLKFEGQSVTDDWTNDIVYDDGNAYYIVQVLEAVKDLKLRNVSKNNYAQTRGQDVMDEIVDSVAKVVGETGSYATLSRNHWLKKMDLYYFDQEVYDYFKDNYPDLEF